MSGQNRGRRSVHGSRIAIYPRKLYVILSYHGVVWSHHSNFLSKWIQYQSKDKSGSVHLQQKSLYCEATDTRLGGYVKTVQIYEVNNMKVSTIVDVVSRFLEEYKLIKRTFLLSAQNWGRTLLKIIKEYIWPCTAIIQRLCEGTLLSVYWRISSLNSESFN